MKFLVFVLFVCPLIAQEEPGEAPASILVPPIALTAASSGFLAGQPAAPGSLTLMPDYSDHPSKRDGKSLYKWSLAAVAAGNAADTWSSWNRPEANLFLAKPGSDFNLRSMALKSVFIGASLVIQRWALSHNSGLYRPLAWLNFTIGAALGGVAAHNAALH